MFLIALTVYLEAGILVSRETAAEILGLKPVRAEGFHLDIEDYLMGLLQLTTELVCTNIWLINYISKPKYELSLYLQFQSRFATNSVTLGDYDRPLQISHFVSNLNAGFRLLNLKNDGLRKRFDTLKYDVKKIEEIVYDISIRGLKPEATSAEVGDAVAAN